MYPLLNLLRHRRIINFIALVGVALLVIVTLRLVTAEQRSQVSYLRGPYNIAYFNRHNKDFRLSAAFHFNHGKQDDVLLLTPFERHELVDTKFDKESVEKVMNPPHTEPTMELYGPYTARAMFRVFRAIDWTHMHHEQTYDILSDKDIPWNKKKQWTDRSVRYYCMGEVQINYTKYGLQLLPD